MDLMTSQEVNTTFNDVKGCDEVKDRNLGLFERDSDLDLEKTLKNPQFLVVNKMFGS